MWLMLQQDRADDCVHLAGEDLHVDTVQRANRAELLADTCQLQDRLPDCVRGYHGSLAQT